MEKTGKGTAALIVAVVVVVIVAAVVTVRTMRSRDAALLRAETIRVEREEAGRRADLLEESLELERARSAVVLGDLATQRRRADSLADVAAARADAGTVRAVETGETLSETLALARGASRPPVTELLDTAVVQLDRHLEADREAVAGFRAEIEALSDARAAEAAAAVVWEERALLAEATLEAKTVECNLCVEEVQALHDARDPGFFAKIADRVGTVVVSMAGGVLLAVILI